MTEEAKHTPGPWDIQDRAIFKLDAHGRVNRFCALVQGGYVNGGRNLPFGDAPVRTSDAEVEANARLIAAAPELFEYVESSAQNGCATAIALIAKAKGKP